MRPTLEKTEPETFHPSSPASNMPNSTTNPNVPLAAGSSMRPPQVPLPELPVQPPKKSKKKWFLMLALLLVIAGAIALVLMLPKKDKKQSAQSTKPVASVKPGTTQKPPYMFIVDYQKRKAILTDILGKQIYSTSMSSAPNYEASSLGKQILVSSYDYNTQISTYTLLDKEGKAQVISPVIQKLLGDHTNINRSFTMLTDDIVIAAVCTSMTTANNACKILQLNLLTGDQKTLLETNAPSAFATGESIFNIINASNGRKTVYLEVGGPTKLGTSKDALYSFDPGTAQAKLVYELPKDRTAENMSLSPDGNKLIYDAQGGSAQDGATIYTVDLTTKKENSVVWDKNNITGGALPFVWSQDNKKVSVIGYKVVKGQVSTIGPLTLAYIDFNQNKITDLQTIQDSAHQNIERLYWSDNSTLVYGVDTSTANSDFSTSTGQVYKQSLFAASGTKITAPAGHLDQLLFW